MSNKVYEIDAANFNLNSDLFKDDEFISIKSNDEDDKLLIMATKSIRISVINGESIPQLSKICVAGNIYVYGECSADLVTYLLSIISAEYIVFVDTEESLDITCDTYVDSTVVFPCLQSAKDIKLNVAGIKMPVLVSCITLQLAVRKSVSFPNLEVICHNACEAGNLIESNSNIELPKLFRILSTVNLVAKGNIYAPNLDIAHTMLPTLDKAGTALNTLHLLDRTSSVSIPIAGVVQKLTQEFKSTVGCSVICTSAVLSSEGLEQYYEGYVERAIKESFKSNMLKHYGKVANHIVFLNKRLDPLGRYIVYPGELDFNGPAQILSLPKLGSYIYFDRNLLKIQSYEYHSEDTKVYTCFEIATGVITFVAYKKDVACSLGCTKEAALMTLNLKLNEGISIKDFITKYEINLDTLLSNEIATLFYIKASKAYNRIEDLLIDLTTHFSNEVTVASMLDIAEQHKLHNYTVFRSTITKYLQ